MLISRFLTCSEVTRKNCLEAAEEALSILEELEMQPPPRLENYPSEGGARVVFAWEEEK